jgi:hypothetical protein
MPKKPLQTGDTKLDKHLAKLEQGGGSTPKARRALVRTVVAWPGSHVTPGLAQCLNRAADTLKGAYVLKKAQRPTGLALRMAALGLVSRHEPHGEQVLVDLYEQSGESMARSTCAETLLGQRDPLDDEGHAIHEFDPRLIAGPKALGQLAKKLPRYESIEGWQERQWVLSAAYLQDPKQSFNKLGRLLTDPRNKRERVLQKDLLHVLILHVRMLTFAGDLRWKKALQEVVQSNDEHRDQAQRIIKWSW